MSAGRNVPAQKTHTPSLPPVRFRQAARPKRTLELMKILSTLNRHPTLTYYVLDPGDGRRGDRGTPQSGVRKHGPGHFITPVTLKFNHEHFLHAKSMLAVSQELL